MKKNIYIISLLIFLSACSVNYHITNESFINQLKQATQKQNIIKHKFFAVEWYTKKYKNNLKKIECSTVDSVKKSFEVSPQISVIFEVNKYKRKIYKLNTIVIHDSIIYGRYLFFNDSIHLNEIKNIIIKRPFKKANQN